MRKLIPALAVFVVLILVWLLFPKTKINSASPSENSIASEKYSTAVTAALTSAPPAAVAAIDASFARVTASPAPAPAARVIPDGRPFAPEVTNMEPQIVLEIVSRAIRNYGQRFGGNPVGSNAEITRALGGDNPGQVNFINGDEGIRVNEKGELIDAWGTPFFFHQLSGTEMEIHSAGADKILWTADDLVTR